MDLQFFFFEITYGCNINREQEQIFMFKLYLKFPGTAEKQSQRQRPEMAEAPLMLLWGRHLSAAYKSATSKRGRHSCQEYFSLWTALSTSFAFSKPAHEQNLQNLTDKRGGRAAAAPPSDSRPRESLSPAALPPSHHGSHLLQHACSSQKTRLQMPAREQRTASSPCIFITVPVTRSARNIWPKPWIFNRNISKTTTAQH